MAQVKDTPATDLLAPENTGGVTDGDDQADEDSRFRVVWNAIIRGLKIFITFLFSHVGLMCAVAGYTFAGGLMFQALELPYERGVRDSATVMQNSTVDKIVEYMYSDEAFRVLRKPEWNARMRKILREHETELHALTHDKNWDGSFGEEGYQWTFANALLYSVTVITTIGYGNIAPKTGWGQFITILYASFGIPLFMLCLRNIGNLMAGCFRLIYRYACVNMTYHYIRLQRRRMKNKFVTRLKTKSHVLKKWAKRKQSEVSTMIHTAIDEHRHSIPGGIISKLHSHEDVHGELLDPIEENIECDDEEKKDNGNESMDVKKLNVSADNIQASHSDSACQVEGKQRRNTICTINRSHTSKFHRKHSLTSSKHHKSRDSLRHAKSHEKSKSSVGSGLIVITEDEIAVGVDDLDQERTHSESDKASTVSSQLSLRDFEADEKLLKARLKQTRNLVPISVCLLIMIGYIILGAMIFTPWEENWDFLIGFYFCFITLTTIGFGDFVPGMASSWDNDEKRVFCLLYLLLGMALLAMSFDLILEEVKHTFKKIAVKIGLLENRITTFLDKYDAPDDDGGEVDISTGRIKTTRK